MCCCVRAWAWCKAFTRIERALVLLQLLLIAIFLGFLLFLILHFVACAEKLRNNSQYQPNPIFYTTVSNEEDNQLYNYTTENVTYSSKSTESYTTSSDKYSEPNQTDSPNEVDGITTEGNESNTHNPIPTNITLKPTTRIPSSTTGKGVQCTWKPAQQTDAGTRYYLNGSTNSKLHDVTYRPNFVNSKNIKTEISFLYILIKMEGSNSKLGCILTAVSKYWLVTAASCVEDIKKSDSLSNYDIVEVLERRRTSVADVKVHPQHGTSLVYDVAALRSNAPLTSDGVALATGLDYLLLTIGEKLTLLRYGDLRNVESAQMNGLHAETKYKLPRGSCISSRRKRHLRPLEASGDVHRALCVGNPSRKELEQCAAAEDARVPCNGAPAMLRGALLAVTTARCDRSCSPNVLAIIPAARFWLDRVIRY